MRSNGKSVKPEQADVSCDIFARDFAAFRAPVYDRDQPDRDSVEAGLIDACFEDRRKERLCIIAAAASMIAVAAAAGIVSLFLNI